jgi:hypothetical protein
MLDQEVINPGLISINGIKYRLARDASKIPYKRSVLPEPPWSEGEPLIISDETITWHRGGFKSKQGITGTSEYGENSDARWPFALVAGPQIQTITLATSTNEPLRGVVDFRGGTPEVANADDYLWAWSDDTIYRINKSTQAVTVSLTTGLSIVVQLIFWEGDLYAVEANDGLLRLTAIGSPDTWDVTNDVLNPVGLVQHGNRLAKARLLTTPDQTQVQNIVQGLDPTVAANWADEVLIPGAPLYITSTHAGPAIVAFDKTVIIRTFEGIFGIEEDGTPVNIMKRLPGPTYTMKTIEPYIYISHSSGLYRWYPGSLEACGLEQEILNESPVIGPVVALEAIGKWIFASIENAISSNDNYLLVGREAEAGEQSLGPIIWDTFLNLGQLPLPYWLYASDQWDSGYDTLFFPYGGSSNTVLGFINMTITGGAPPWLDTTFLYPKEQSAERYTVRYRFNDWHDKDFVKVAIKCKDCASARKWAIAYRIDDGSWVTTDINGSTMEVTDDDLHEFILATTASGMEIQFRLTYTGTTTSTTNASRVVYFEPFARPQSQKSVIHDVVLIIQNDLMKTGGREQQTAEASLANLTSLEETASPVTVVLPWGSSINASIRSVEVSQTLQTGEGSHTYLASVTMEER